MRFAVRLLLAVFMLLLMACRETEQPKASTLERIREQGVLRVATRNSPSTYYHDRNGPTGLEYDLANDFAESLGVRLELITLGSIDELYQSLSGEGGVDLVAAGLYESSHRRPQARFSDSYGDARLQVVYNINQPAPRAIEDLIGRSITVVAGSVQAEWLKAAQVSHPELKFEESSELEVLDLLQQVDQRELDVTLVGSNELAMNKFSFSRVRVGFDLEPGLKLAWALPVGEDISLLEQVNAFFASHRQDGSLASLEERYYGHLEELDYVGTYTFARHLQQRLPDYEQTFRQAADTQGLDWRLLAAMGYQESKWDPTARSKTGVRGLMMLTLRTARSLGVTDRLDPTQSINGGARYLLKLRKRLPESIKEPDRTWLALAAYNVGYGHMEDARRLAQAEGLNPNRWLDVKKMLPRLSQKKWYSQTRYGYARGGEPVHYVNNIRRYYDILTWISQPRLEGEQLASGSSHQPGLAGPGADGASSAEPRL